jgi:MFS family permease
MTDHQRPQDAAYLKVTAWTPLRQPIFRALWTANLVSNIGTWMQSTASAWLMTSLTPSTVMVALVQTASTLPLFLLAMPAGALADIIDRRRLLLLTQSWMLVAAGLLSILTFFGHTTPWVLLLLTLMLGLGAAANGPSWLAMVPELVSGPELHVAVALNSAGFNAARSIGPALGGLVVGSMGPGMAFLLNAVSYLGVIAVLLLWKRPTRESALPAERVLGAMRTGIRYVRHAPALRAILIRVAAFATCASVIMALLPLVARQQLGVGSVGYGLLLASFGVGAVAGAVFLPALKRRFTLDALAVLATIVSSMSLVAIALINHFLIICGALVLFGVAWLVLVSSFNAGVQTGVPAWVRGRALAVYIFILFGGMAGGSLLWGAVATFFGIPQTLVFSAIGLMVGLITTMRYRLSSGEARDFSPSMHWPVPHLPVEPQPEEGPVLITVEYHINPSKWQEFEGGAMRRLRRSRLRGGAMRWRLFLDAADPGRYLETFLVESWLEHLRQHERVTMADRQIETEVRAYHVGKEPPAVTHFLARSLPREP